MVKSRALSIVVVWSLLVAVTHADVILTAAAVNDALKKMERLSRDATSQQGAARANSLFDLASTADQLTTLINDDVAAHGKQEQKLIDLAVTRSAESGVVIALNRDGLKYFYDNAGFKDYLRLAPRGAHAERAQFKVLEGEFFAGAPPDDAALEAAAVRKREFLAAFPKSPSAPEVYLMLSVDYRDLYLRAKKGGNSARQARFSDLTRRQLRALISTHADSEQAAIGRRMLARFEELVQQQ